MQKCEFCELYFPMTTEDGVKHHVFYTSVGGNTDWVLINVLDDSEVFGKLRSQHVMLLIPSIIGLLIAGFIVWGSSRNLERLRVANAEKERIGGELHVASKIQQNMLPRQDFRNDEVDIGGHSPLPVRWVAICMTITSAMKSFFSALAM